MAVDKDGKPLGFLKTTLMGAVLVVVPIGIIGFALWQITSLFRSLLLPVVEKLPFDSIFLRYSVIAMALSAVFLLCYFTGVAVRTRWGSAMRGWIERFLLERILCFAQKIENITEPVVQKGTRSQTKHVIFSIKP